MTTEFAIRTTHHSRGETREVMKELFEVMEGDHLEVEVILTQRDHTIYFTKTHRQDLLTVIAASQLSCGQSATEPE